MKPPWKKVAERAWKTTFSSDEIAEAVPRALLRECDPALVRQLEKALIPADQGALFDEIPQEVAARVDRLRASCPGSSFGSNLIDAAIYEIYHRTPGASILDAALESALRATAECAYRGIEEHGLRHGGLTTSRALRANLESADSRVDYQAIRNGLRGTAAQRLSQSIPKKSGINEGVPL